MNWKKIYRIISRITIVLFFLLIAIIFKNMSDDKFERWELRSDHLRVDAKKQEQIEGYEFKEKIFDALRMRLIELDASQERRKFQIRDYTDFDWDRVCAYPSKTRIDSIVEWILVFEKNTTIVKELYIHTPYKFLEIQNCADKNAILELRLDGEILLVQP